MGKIIKLSIGGVLILILAAFSFYNNQKNVSNSVQKDITLPNFQSLPEFTAVDIFGNSVSTRDLERKNVFIQFIDPNSESQRKALRKICKNFKNEEFIIVVFVKDSESQVFDRFMDEIRFAIGHIFLITDDYKKYKKIFKASPCCETFSLFDCSGNLILTDLNWKLLINDTMALLRRFNGNKELSLFNYIKSGKNIKDLVGFKYISETIKKERDYNYFLISMFTNICMDCPSGRLIDQLKKSYELLNNSIFYLAVLSSNYEDNDIDNLKTLLKIKFPVVKADDNLLKKWNELTLGAKESKKSNIVFLLNNIGEIIKVIEPNNYKEFFDYLNGLNIEIKN